MTMEHKPYTITPYKVEDGWKVKVVAGNNRTVYRSEEPFDNKSYAVEKVQELYPDAVVGEEDKSAHDVEDK